MYLSLSGNDKKMKETMKPEKSRPHIRLLDIIALHQLNLIRILKTYATRKSFLFYLV